MSVVEQLRDQYRIPKGFWLLALGPNGSEASYWIAFGDGWDAIKQLFPDLDLSNIIILDVEEEKESGIPDAKEEEEGCNDEAPGNPMKDDTPIAASAPTESALAALTEGVLVFFVPMDATPQLAIEVLSES
ncbi:hypothetical protein COCNU_scaffold002779G000030 [Cocos nucifera]|nr:hypothetical protein [Cocos nucifera]